jgi:hypothetical protein
LRWPRDTLYPQKLALTSPTSGGRSVGRVRLWTKGHGVNQYMWKRDIVAYIRYIPLLQNKICLMVNMPVTVAARSKTWNVFALSNAGIVGSNPTQAFILCSCCRVGSGLATGWSPIQGVLPTVWDSETEVKRSVSRMPYVPSGSSRIKDT